MSGRSFPRIRAIPACPLCGIFPSRWTTALESVFGPGTVLQVTGTDGKSFVDVITSDGVTGCIAIEQPAGDWQWYIDGESELEYFELVPYVG
ncbi:MAG: hypothetical protein ACLU3I_05925 [Acutalibacteraceae bacterium]